MHIDYIATLAAVLGALAPLVRAWVHAHVAPQRIAQVKEMAGVAVQAAEQLGKDVPGTNGAAKLNYASELVVSMAKRVGVKLSTDEVLGFVHAALREMQRFDTAWQQ